jgi:ATP-dependent protease ClpP protease subunit
MSDIDTILAVVEENPIKKTLFMIGEINENVTNEVIQELVSIDWATTTIKDLDIYVSSQGGFLSDCFAIIDFILHVKKTYNIRVNTYGLGEVSSAGFFLFLLGDTRYLFPSCRVFVHSHITIGDEKPYDERVRADKAEEKELYNNYVSYMSTQLDLSMAKTKNLLKKSKWLSKKEITAYNIAKENKCTQ